MIRNRFFLMPLLVLTLVAHSRAWSQSVDAKPDLAANAAIKYAQAFALLPSLDKEQEKLLEQWQRIPLDAAARKLIDKSQMSRVYLHRGAMLKNCDWGLDYEDGIRLLVPHVIKARTLARLTALHARQEFEQKHWKAGAEDVTDILRLARHVETDPLMIIQLVGYNIERQAIEAAAPYPPELKPFSAEMIPAVDALPPGPTLKQMLLIEARTGGLWFLEELKRAEQRKPGGWQEVWNEVLSVPEEGNRQARDLVNSAKTYEEAIKAMEKVLPLYDQLTKLSERPWREFDAQYPEFAKQAKAADPLAGFILPNMPKFLPMYRRAQAQMAQFRAALAIIQGGPDKLKDIQDPFGDGPFQYKALDKGFELASRLKVQGKPVTLVVGQGK
jgi:hypothetical protein